MPRHNRRWPKADLVNMCAVPIDADGRVSRGILLRRLDIDATPLAVRSATEDLALLIKDRFHNPDLTAQAELILAETLNNIVEHAYRGSGAGRIKIWLHESANHLRVDLIDSGIPMPGGTIPDPAPVSPMTDTKALPEGGFGWPLIHQIADAVFYQRENAKNCLTFHIDTGTLPPNLAPSATQFADVELQPENEN